MAAKKKTAKLAIHEIKDGKLKKTRKKIAVDAFTPIGRAAEKEAREHADDKAEAAELKRRYERRRRAH